MNTVNKVSKTWLETILKHKNISVFIFSIFGLLLSFYYELTMDKDAWFWFFSSIAQTLAALVALVAIFLIFQLESYNVQIKNKYDYLRLIIPDIIQDKDSKYFAASDEFLKKDSEKIKLSLDYSEAMLWENTINKILHIEMKKVTFKNNFKKTFSYSLAIVMLSIILLPLGSVSTENINILYIWNKYNLKWFFIYACVGYCIIILYQIAYNLVLFFDND